MSRNRRNLRRSPRIKEFLSSRNFKMTVIILIAIIIVAIGINVFRGTMEKITIAKQQEAIKAQSEEIFSLISENIEETNKNISESEVIIKLSAIGDILCSNDMINDAHNSETNSYNFNSMFANIKEIVSSADVVMGNLQTNITNGDYNSNNAPKEFTQALKDSGVNLVSIANDKNMNSSASNLKNTIENLEEQGYTVTGNKTGKENNVIIKEIKNSKIAFLSYGYKLEGSNDSINEYSEEQAKKDIEYAKKQEADYICVMIHWGIDLNEEVSDEQKKVVDVFVNNGANLILGSHPSVIQKTEIKQNSDGGTVLIAYSLGTYISTSSGEDAKTEVILNIELRKNGKDGEIYLNKVDYTPIYVLDNGESAQDRFELIDMKETAMAYKGDKTDKISKETYDELVVGLNKLNELLSMNNSNKE